MTINRPIIRLLCFLMVAFILDYTDYRAQNLTFEHITVEQGLSSNHIYDIFQDKKGFLWICTEDGLNRYDGYGFRHYKHDPGDTNSLRDYAAQGIYEDSEGIFWIVTREGLNRFDPVRERFTHLLHEKEDSNSLSSDKVTDIIEDKYSNLWIATRQGLNLFDRKTGRFKRFMSNPEDPSSLSHNFVNTLYLDSGNNLWVGTQLGLNRYDYSEGKFQSYYRNSEDPNSLSANFVTFIFEDSKGRLWIGTTRGLNRVESVETDSVKFVVYNDNSAGGNSSPFNNLRAIAEDGEGNLWIATMGNGVTIFNPDKGEINVVRNTPGISNSLSDDVISSVFKDKSGIVWLGSYTKGLNKFDPGRAKFNLFKPEHGGGPLKGGINISAIIIDDKDRIWLGTNGSGIKVYRNAGMITQDDLLFEFKSDDRAQYSLGSNDISSMLLDREGIFWIGTYGSGLMSYDPNAGRFVRYRSDRDDPGSLSHDFVHTLYEDADGDIWVGTGLGGACKFNKEDGFFKRYMHNRNAPGNPNQISAPEVVAVYQDNRGDLWFGTTLGGLNRFDKKKESFRHYKHDVDDKKSVSSNRIITIRGNDSDGLWIGTFNGGLNRFDYDTESFEYFTEKDGLAGNSVYAIAEDKNGFLWISTDKGISRFDPFERTFKNYDISDGLQGKEFNPNSVFNEKEEGAIYFGGLNGLNYFKPDLIKDKQFIPDLVFTDFRIFNESVRAGEDSPLKVSMPYSNEIRLSYRENVFSIEFSSLDYSNSKAIQYAYFLEGFEKGWRKTNSRRAVTYTNLDPGSYVFKVKGSNSDGIWNENEARIRIVISPPLWRTWWAYSFYLLLIVSIFTAIRKYELSRIKLRNELELKNFESKKLQEIDKMKSSFFANISHEFRTPLTIILGTLEKLRSQSDRKEYSVMKRNAAKLLQLINQLLELSKIETGNIKLKISEVDIYKFLRRVTASFSSLAYHKDLELLFNGSPIDVYGKDEKISVHVDYEKLETVFYNLLSNAVKFSPEGGRVEVTINSDNENVKIKFLNTGVEIPSKDIPRIFDRFYQIDNPGMKNYEGSGIGLALVKEFIELHGGRIEVESSAGITEFIVYLPLGKSHFKEEEILSGEISPEIHTKEIDNKSDFGGAIGSREEKTESDIILIVEDNRDLREMIKEVLSGQYLILEADTGKRGLEVAEVEIPDLIISDIMMPEMNGYELSKLIKSNEKTNHIPLIILTAKAAKEDKLEGLETGADDYLIKPFEKEELRLKVRNLITGRKRMREKFSAEMLLKPSNIVVPSNQRVFLQKLTSILEKNIENESFSVETLCVEIAMSRAQLHRKMRALTNRSTSEFIREFRLQRAADLLRQDAGNIAEIAYKVGFGSQAYFTKLFQEKFGCTPSEFRKNQNL